MKQFNNETIKTVFFGNGNYVIPILQTLKKNFEVALVLTTEKSPILASQGETLQNSPIIKFCKENKISFLSVRKLNNSTISAIKQSDAEIGILANFGFIIPRDILNIFPNGIINVHPSLLPKYRGPSPVQFAILKGEEKTGVTIIKLDEEVDHGPILAQIEEPIKPSDTAETLYKRLFEKGAKLLPQNINNYIKGDIKLSEQDHSKATFTKTLSRKDGYIDLSSLEIRHGLGNWKLEIARRIRAFYPWPGVWFRANLGQTTENRQQKTVKLLPNNLTTQRPNDPFLIQVEGKKPMSYKDFINGYAEGKRIIDAILS